MSKLTDKLLFELIRDFLQSIFPNSAVAVNTQLGRIGRL